MSDDLNQKLDYIIRRLDDLYLIVKEHGMRISVLERAQLRAEVEGEHEQSTVELQIYRAVAGNLWKVSLAVITAVMVALAMGWLKL